MVWRGLALALLTWVALAGADVPPADPPLSEAETSELLAEAQAWLTGGSSEPGGGGAPTGCGSGDHANMQEPGRCGFLSNVLYSSMQPLAGRRRERLRGPRVFECVCARCAPRVLALAVTVRL